MWTVVSRLQFRLAQTEVQVRLLQGREIALSRAALALIGNPERVVLEIDTERQLLSVRPAVAGDGEAFTLTGKGLARRFSTQSLTRRYGLSTERQAFTPTLDGQRLVFGPYLTAAPGPEKVRQMLAAANGSRR